jgi:CrcB protein
MIKLLIVGTGGFFGAILRYLVSGWVYYLCGTGLPYGTFAVNILGCLIFGLLAGLMQSREILTHNFRLLVMVGLLGSFTTFSTFSYETFTLMNDNQYLSAVMNVLMSVVVGILALIAGYKIAAVI